MRCTMKAFVLALALVPAACASAKYEPIPVYGSLPLPPTFRLIETPAVAPPANDIPESERRAWIEANRSPAAYVPAQDDPVADGSACGGGCHDHGWGFGLPISLGFGYSSGCHGGGGFGVGVNVLGLGVGVGIGGW